MSAVKYNFELNQGETFDTTFTVLYADRRPFDLTGYLVRGQVRQAYTDSAPLVTFTCEVADPAAGRIRMSLTAAETAALDFTKGVYDIEVESEAGVVTRVVQGVVTLSKEVTRG